MLKTIIILSLFSLISCSHIHHSGNFFNQTASSNSGRLSVMPSMGESHSAQAGAFQQQQAASSSMFMMMGSPAPGF